jgi:serine/threonine-protein kinase HipA
MAIKTTTIYVYADWIGMQGPKLIGILSAQQAKDRKSFSFEYDTAWLKSNLQFMLDPDISLFSGTQYPNQKANFGVFFRQYARYLGKNINEAQSSTRIQN